MSWRLRHAGSPKAVGGLTLTQIAQGLADDRFDTSDEVLGPGERRWLPIEAHPKLEQLASELDEARTRKVDAEDPEEQRIDMNPLIDVCLVLLVFFILATTMSVLERVMNIPQSRAQATTWPTPRTYAEVREFSILVKAVKENGTTVIRLEDRVVPLGELQSHLASQMGATHRTELLIAAEGVEWATVVSIMDAASGAGIRRVQFLKTTGAARAP
jgi:biopolymer transport protein ExbD